MDNATVLQLTPRRFFLFLAILIIVAFHSVVLGGQSFVFRDFSLFGYPLMFHGRTSLWNGEIPLWNPLNSCGMPFLAQWNTLVLYPLSLIYLLLPLPWSANIFSLFHLFLAGVSMFYLARRWTKSDWSAAAAATLFVFNGLLLDSLMWPNNIAALAWMPLVVLAVEKAWNEGGRWIFAAAAVSAMQMLAGAPEVILFTWAILCVLLLAQLIGQRQGFIRNITRLATIGLLTAGITAAQLLPFLQLLANSSRSTTDSEMLWPMPIWGWINLVSPLFHCYEAPNGVFFQSHQDWTSSYYAGIGGVALALVAIVLSKNFKAKTFAGLTLIALLLALGPAGHFYTWLSKIFPPLHLMRFPVKFVLVPTFCFPLLAAFGWTAIQNAGTERQRRVLWTTVASSVFLAIVVVLSIAWAHNAPASSENPTTTLKNGIARIAFLSIVVVTAIVVLRANNSRTQFIAGSCLVLALAFDGLTHAPWQNPSIDANAFAPGLLTPALNPFPRPGIGRALPDGETKRLIWDRQIADLQSDFIGRRVAIGGNLNLLDQIATPDGFFSLDLVGIREINRRLLYSPSDAYPKGLADFLSITQTTDVREMLQWKTRPSALPYITAGAKPVFAPLAQHLDLIGQPTFNARETVYLDDSLHANLLATNDPTAAVSNIHFDAHNVAADVHSKATAIVVIAQAYYPNWLAYVDNVPTKIFRANLAFQGIEVPAGDHHVKLVYRDRMFRYGVAISLITMVVCIWGWFGYGRRNSV